MMNDLKIHRLSIDRLSTQRLILIPFTIQICEHLTNGDFSDISNLGLRKGISWPDMDVMETLPKIIINLSHDAAPTGYESWMIVKKDSMEVIGDCGFKGVNYDQKSIDIGYGIIKEERRKGFAEEAVKGLINWVMSEGLIKEITAKCLIDNLSSIHLLKKLKFSETKTEDEMMHWSLAL